MRTRKDHCSWQPSGPLKPDKLHGNYWRSSVIRMLGFEWVFEFRPNCDGHGTAVMTLHLQEMPPDVLRIFMKQHDRLMETNTVCERTSYYDRDHLVWGWPLGTLKTESIEHLSTLSFSTEITLISVYGADGNEITNRYDVMINDGMKSTEKMNGLRDITSILNANDDGHCAQNVDGQQIDDSLDRLDSMVIQVSEIMDSIKMMQNTLKEIRTIISNDRQKATHVINGQFFK